MVHHPYLFFSFSSHKRQAERFGRFDTSVFYPITRRRASPSTSKLTRSRLYKLTREIGEGHGGALNTRIKNYIRPALDNQSIRGAVRDYIVGGARKQRVVTKYGEISNSSRGSGSFSGFSTMISSTLWGSEVEFEGVLSRIDFCFFFDGLKILEINSVIFSRW